MTCTQAHVHTYSKKKDLFVTFSYASNVSFLSDQREMKVNTFSFADATSGHHHHPLFVASEEKVRKLVSGWEEYVVVLTGISCQLWMCLLAQNDEDWRQGQQMWSIDNALLVSQPSKLKASKTFFIFMRQHLYKGLFFPLISAVPAETWQRLWQPGQAQPDPHVPIHWALGKEQSAATSCIYRERERKRDFSCTIHMVKATGGGDITTTMASSLSNTCHQIDLLWCSRSGALSPNFVVIGEKTWWQSADGEKGWLCICVPWMPYDEPLLFLRTSFGFSSPLFFWLTDLFCRQRRHWSRTKQHFGWAKSAI